MKYLLGLFLLVPCAAYAQQGIQNVHEVATTTTTIIQTANLCAQTATGLSVAVASNMSSGTLSGYFAAEVYNLAASTNTIVCGFDAATSSSPASSFYGREVPAGVGVYWAVPSYRTLYCATTNNLGCTRYTLTQLK